MYVCRHYIYISLIYEHYSLQTNNGEFNLYVNIFLTHDIIAQVVTFNPIRSKYEEETD